ncbi:nuclease A inhibitor family protein [Pedobacter nototheniae]|uniref:nuclease A inhibitor family protein n=1 Tax=Pedobacter nototheniae TaxID=2488994 RepID=UPI0029308D27|nr:nuclease A inhibitor family protein [Pedobacter nototheniae]
MENTTVLNTITDLLKGTLYFSESESPFTVNNWGQVTKTDLTGKIAAITNAAPEQLKTINIDVFFEHLTSKADPADLNMVKNAAKLRTFYEYLKKNLTDLQVTRAETGSRIPIIISGYLSDGSCIAVQTQAVET